MRCRGSVPANSADQPCVPDSRSTLSPTSVAGIVTANALSASTVTPELGVGAGASVTRPSISLPGLAISANVLSATATYGCQAGQPVPGGGSQVVGLTINGTAISVPAGPGPVTIPLGALGSLTLNQTVQTSNSLTHRALALTTPVASVVIAEATVDLSGSPCAISSGGGGGGGGTGGTGGGSGGGPVLTVTGTSPGRVPTGGTFPVALRTHNKGKKTATRERTCVKLSSHTRLKSAPGAHRVSAKVYCWPYRNLRAKGTERHTLRVRISGVCGRYMYALLYTGQRREARHRQAPHPGELRKASAGLRPRHGLQRHTGHLQQVRVLPRASPALALQQQDLNPLSTGGRVPAAPARPLGRRRRHSPFLKRWGLQRIHPAPRDP